MHLTPARRGILLEFTLDKIPVSKKCSILFEPVHSDNVSPFLSFKLCTSNRWNCHMEEIRNLVLIQLKYIGQHALAIEI